LKLPLRSAIDGISDGWMRFQGAFSQGRTIKEVQENLKEAVQLILESQQELRVKGMAGKILKRKI